ncbi:hypothetical protein GCM10009854_39780 [Saccharopolyspora halophila]|uniref:Secreted protein n=1 Tax=Saccharopolyspora halophila TaxID=405551 RepID=A0ABN3GPQ4_9PSEU
MAKRIGVLAAVALVVGMTFLQRSDSRLTTARQPAEAVCRTEAEITACMWPEHGEHLDRWLKIARRYRETFADIQPRATLFAEKGTKWTGPEPIPIGSIEPGTSDEHLVESLVTSTLRRPPDCARLPSDQPGMTSYGPYPGMIGRDLAAAWMKHRIRPHLPPQGLGVPGREEQVERLLAAPEAIQVDSVRRALQAGDECENPMPELP